MCSINIYSSGGVEDGEGGGGNVFDVIDPVLLLAISFERRPLNMAVHVFEPDTLMALFFSPFSRCWCCRPGQLRTLFKNSDAFFHV